MLDNECHPISKSIPSNASRVMLADAHLEGQSLRALMPTALNYLGHDHCTPLQTAQNLRAPGGSGCETEQTLVLLRTWAGWGGRSGKASLSSPRNSGCECAVTSPVCPILQVYSPASHRCQRCLPHDQGYRPYHTPLGKALQKHIVTGNQWPGTTLYHNTFE